MCESHTQTSCRRASFPTAQMHLGAAGRQHSPRPLTPPPRPSTKGDKSHRGVWGTGQSGAGSGGHWLSPKLLRASRGASGCGNAPANHAQLHESEEGGLGLPLAPPGILIPQNCHPGELPVTVPSPGTLWTPRQIPSCTGGSLVLPASLAHTSPEVHAGALSPSSGAVSSQIKSSCRSSPPFPLPPDPRVSRAPLSEPTLGSDIISLPRYISSAVDLR